PAGVVIATYSIYTFDEQRSWRTASPPIVNGTRDYIEFICREIIGAYRTPPTNREAEELKAFLNNQLLCYAAHVDVFTKKYSGYWAKITGFCAEGPIDNRIPHFDFLSAYFTKEYKHDCDIPIGKLCVSPFHFASTPLYLEHFHIPRLAARARKLYKKLEPTPDWNKVDIIEIDAQGKEGQDNTAPSSDPLPFPAPTAEDGYPEGSDT
ncbi:unnamed protein product, partial [Peniophora sp. CBMAI 1063]